MSEVQREGWRAISDLKKARPSLGSETHLGVPRSRLWHPSRAAA